MLYKYIITHEKYLLKSGVACLRKYIFALMLFSLVVLLPSCLYASEETELTTEDFFRRLSFAYSRVPSGISKAQIESDIKRVSENSIMLGYNSSVMILVNTHKGVRGTISNIAVTYFLGDPELENTASLHGNDKIFESICTQVIYAVNKNITAAAARNLLSEIGLFGPMLDGVQRSRTLSDYSYILRLQPNDMAVMVISHAAEGKIKK